MERKRWLKLVTAIFIVLLGWYIFQSYSKQANTTEIYQVGILISGPERMEKVRGLKAGLQELGFIENMNVHYIIQDADNQFAKMEQYAKDLDQMDLDVIITGGAIETKYLKANKEATTPVVFLGVADAIHLHLVESYQNPNGRFTGVENSHVALSGKRLQLFHMLLPEMKRVIVIYDENIDASLLSLKQVQKVAEDLAIPIEPISIANEQQWEQFNSKTFNQDDGLLVLPSYYLEEISAKLGKFALEKGVPIFGVNSNDVNNGFLMSYGIAYDDQGYQGAKIVSQILKGIRPQELPVERPDTVRLLVNPDTEQKLNITFSEVGNAFVHRIDLEK